MMCARLLRSVSERKPGRLFLASERVFQLDARRVRGEPRVGSAALAADDADPRRYDRAERLSLRPHPEGILSPAGRRAHDRLDPGRTRASRSRRCRQKLDDFAALVKSDPAVENVGWLHRRRPAQLRLHVHHAEAPEGAQGQRRPGDRAAAPKARSGARGESLSRAGPGHPHGRGGRRTRSTSFTAAGRRARGLAPLGAARAPGARANCPRSPTSTPTSRTRACRRRSSSTAPPPRAWASPRG